MRMMDPMCKLGFCLDDFLQVYYKMANEMYVRSKFYEVLGPELFETRKPVYESIVYKFSAWTSKHSKAPALAITKIDSNFLQRALKRGIKSVYAYFEIILDFETSVEKETTIESELKDDQVFF